MKHSIVFASLALFIVGCTSLTKVKQPALAPAKCTVTYTNSKGVTFSATASSCDEAYEMLDQHIEA